MTPFTPDLTQQALAYAVSQGYTPPVVAAPPVISPVPSGVPSKLLWSDEFDQAVLDKTRWEQGGFWYAKGKSVSGGVEKLVPSINPLDGQGNLSLTVSKVGPNWVSDAIDSSPNGATPGFATPPPPYYIEFKAQLPVAAPGLWPALWLLHHNGPYAELDVLEAVGVPSVGYTTWHPSVGNATAVQLGPSVAPGWHTYGAEVSASGAITPYVDAVAKTTIAAGPTATAPMFIVISLSIGAVGSWAGPATAATPSTVTMLVDYVRVFARLVADAGVLGVESVRVGGRRRL